MCVGVRECAYVGCACVCVRACLQQWDKDEDDNYTHTHTHAYCFKNLEEKKKLKSLFRNVKIL